MTEVKKDYENILLDLFYPEQDIQQQVLAMTQMSLVDSLNIRKSWDKIKEHLEKWEMPSEYLYLAWAHIYNKNCYSINSPYHTVSILEASWLMKNTPFLDKYLWNTLIDIWCGNWAKPASLLKYMKENGLGKNIRKYVWLDWSASMLRATDDIFHKANIPNLEYEWWMQRFQELESEEVDWTKTFMFLGGSLWTFNNQEELNNFLQDVKNNMTEKDTFVGTVFTLPEEKERKEITDEELKQLQQWFLKAERERYDINNIWDTEKQIDIDIFRSNWIPVTKEDFDTDFFFDEKNQLLIDRKIFKKDIKIWWMTVIEKWFTIDSPGTLLDKHFFMPMVEKNIKDFSESIYNTNTSREFVLNFFERYLKVSEWKLSYRAERNQQDHTMEIFVECLADFNIYIQDDIIYKKKWDKIIIHKSHRFTHEEIENIFTRNWFEIVDGLKVGWDLELLKKLVHEEVMKIYVLKKK